MAGFPGSPRLHMIDLKFLNQNTHHRLTNELSKKYSNCFWQKLTSASVKPSVSQAEAS